MTKPRVRIQSNGMFYTRSNTSAWVKVGFKSLSAVLSYMSWTGIIQYAETWEGI